MDEQEIALGGGNINPAVVRVGDTVRRTINAGSETVHHLLRHLESCGFDRCPRFLGVDTQGREILTFLPGETGFMPYLWEGNEPLIAAARLLRSYHDATLGYAPAPDAAWLFVYPDTKRHEVICHNDFAPYNLVCAEGKPYALFDFDMAGPAPRLRDVAYAVYWFAPLTLNGGPTGMALSDMNEGSRRLHLFCETYGIKPTSALLDMVAEVLRFMGDWLEGQAQAGNAACHRMIDEGHLLHWRQELASFERRRPRLERNLSIAT